MKASQKRLKEVFDGVKSGTGHTLRKQSVASNLEFIQIPWSRMAVQSQGIIFDAAWLSRMLHAREEETKRRNNITVFSLLGVFATYFFANYLLVHRRLLRSFADLQAGTAIVGAGTLDAIIPVKRDDEIGDLFRAFNQMTANLKRITASKTDLEREVREREQAESILQNTLQRFYSVLSSMYSAVMLVDDEGRVGIRQSSILRPIWSEGRAC